ncbi:MAG: phosphotransferase family protein [Chloroflexi bacterium]|nr:phosphotransferase family protein [Chloroflexota bacterium]
MMSVLEQALARIPAWRDRSDLQITFLSGGITNQNYRIDAEGEAFVLRLGGAKSELLGIDRANEYAATRAAAEIGIAPAVVEFILPEGYLVARFIRGRPIPIDAMQETQTIHQVARALQKIHALPAVRATFSPFQVARDYDALARAHGVTAFPENYAWLRAQLAVIETAFDHSKTTPVFCHNDLLNGNFLRDEQGNLRILDWEYAGMGDPFFDLANFAAHHEFDDVHVQQLLDAYFGQVEPRAFARLKLAQAMSDFREGIWGVLQQGISELDFDFRGYANQFFDKLTARLNDPRYTEWLAALE